MIKFGLISRVYQSKLSPLEGHARAEWRFGAWTRTGMEQKKKTEQDERGERDVHGREKRLSRTLTMIFNADFKHHLCQTGFVFIFSRKCLPQVTQGCSGPHTRGISRVSAGSCCAISWPEVGRPTPRIFAPFVQSRHRQTKPAAAPCRAAQLAPRPLPTLASRLGLCIKVARRARYGPTQPKRGVVGCRLWLPAPLRARGKTPSGQVSRSREVYGC